MRPVVLTVATVAFLFAIAVVASPKPSQRYAPTLFNQAHADQQAHIQAFLGVILKTGTVFVFRDDATKATYRLDDQDTAGKFDGQKVRVTGTLDVVNDIIRVQGIEAAA